MGYPIIGLIIYKRLMLRVLTPPQILVYLFVYLIHYISCTLLLCIRIMEYRNQYNTHESF